MILRKKSSTRTFVKSAAIGLFIALCAINFSSCKNATGIGGRSEALSLQAQRSVSRVNAIAITSQADLEEIEDNPAGDYYLAVDITLTDWIPICDSSSPFTGTFDGAGHTITVSSYGKIGDYIGIFATSSGATFANLTVNLAAGPIVTDSGKYAGGLVGSATGTTFDNITVNGSFDLTYTGAVLPWPVLLDGFKVGGVAGYASDISAFNNITTSVAINANATSAPVFVGGVVGFTGQVDNTVATSVGPTTITTAVNSGNITSNGPGYNTSAGGIAGYVVYTKVRNSSSTGDINLTANGVDFDWSDSWQAYAGGLIGYAGGIVNAYSEITNNHTTGSVTTASTILTAKGSVGTFAPFPYAGGLVGYNYGYSDFALPIANTSNGTQITKCYATGDVTSTSQPDPSANVGDIPYAGGLVGYSSTVGALIQDSYATGNVRAATEGTYAWAGGLVGGNAQGSVINRTYATGDVNITVGTLAPFTIPQYTDAGPAGGGITGFNYYSPATVVSNSVALNSFIHGNQGVTQNVLHRVVGSLGNTSGFIGTLKSNLANDSMIVTDNWKSDIGLDNLDGEGTAARPAQYVFERLGWNFNNVWTMSGGYPVLQ